MVPPFRMLQFASYTFDAAIGEILTPLMMGGSVAVPREEDRMNGNIAAVMKKLGVTIAMLTPSYTRILNPDDFTSLKTLILIGEAMSHSHIETWCDRLQLVNGYGPTECTVFTTINSRMTRSSNPANLGRGLGRVWIVDPNNHDRLAPVGSIGELLVEGPTLSTGYLKNEAKTREVFIENPLWAQHEALRYPDIQGTRRMYKTGDLVRVFDDVSGELMYLGRKDSQAKLNGQRLELDEIIHHIVSDQSVQHALVLLPKTGACSKRLVAVLSPRGMVAKDTENKFELVTSKQVTSLVARLQDKLREKLPPYMIPSTWLVVRSIPLLPSGKLDRNSVKNFVERIDEATLDKASAAQDQQDDVEEAVEKAAPITISIDERLKQIWCQVLNITPDRIGRNVSFLHLGGDSITAIQVMARCRAQGIKVTVPDIISSKSVHELALKTGVPQSQSLPYQSQNPSAPAEDAHEFDLSPIQQLYFQIAGSNAAPSSTGAVQNQFNQSVLLRLSKEKSQQVNADQLRQGIHMLAQAHSMLRARFRRDGTGSWRQRLTQDVVGSYRFKTHSLSSPARMEKRIVSSQRSLDFIKGPMMAVDWFSIGSTKANGEEEVVVFITVHHLVIDVVSWGILLHDLEDFLANGKISPPVSMPFQAWSRKQSERAQAETNGHALLPHHEPIDSDLEYWGMAGVPNVQGDVVSADEIELDTETTRMLLGRDCHRALGTELLDVMLAALLVSYRNATTGRRGAAAIFNEGHGRESWDDSIDLSRTVGWFTTFAPVHLPDESSSDDDIISAIRWVKDYRARLAGKGRPYFAYRMLTSQGREEYNGQWPVEVAFNYLGQMQQMSRTDTILQSYDSEGAGQSVNSASDCGKDVPRFALIDISAIVIGGKLKMSFSYNKHMKKQDSILCWIKECHALLREAPRRLAEHDQEKTLSAFPLLGLSYYGVENLGHRLREVGVQLRDVEDVYPCTAMQRGMLLSQMIDPEKYDYRITFEVEHSSGQRLDGKRLCNAWQAVVTRHSTLRTIFVDTVGGDGLMDQVVLRHAPGRLQLLECKDEVVSEYLQSYPGFDYRQKSAHHEFIVCKTSTGRFFCRLQISHALSDGSSIPIILADLADAYKGKLRFKPVPAYREYMAHIQSSPRGESLRYWKDYLSGAEPCLFPSLTDGAKDTDLSVSSGSHVISLPNIKAINAYCADAGITMSVLLQFAWAVVLRSYTGSDEVIFGYVASGRDVPVPNMEHAVGAFINMLVCRMNLLPDTEVGEALDTLRTDLGDAITHQSCSLAEMQHEIDTLHGAALFNTVFTYQKRAGKESLAEKMGINFKVLNAEDTTEYAVAINVEAMDDKVEVYFGHLQNVVSDAQIRNVATAFEQVVSSLVADGRDDMTVGEVDLVGDKGIQQILSWNNFDLPRVERCAHDIIADHVRDHPDKEAVVGWDASFTYKELDNVSTALARYLVVMGHVGPEVIVPLCFEKSAWTIVAQLAVLKAGGAYVGLDPAFPDNRLEGLMQDVGAKLVLCSSTHKEKIDRVASSAFVVNAENIAALQKAPNATVPLGPRATPNNPCYLIFTSGTTGKPKGTIIEHANICTSAAAHCKSMFMKPDSRVLQFASYTFDASILEILSCLLVGGTVCVPSDEDRMNDVAAVIRNFGITWTLLTPSVASTVKPDSVSCLKTLVTGGEAMSPGHIEKWGTQYALVNAYGPTETAITAATSVKVDEDHTLRCSDRSIIGTTGLGCRLWVTDPNSPGRLVPVGAVGELLVEGRTVARGYLNRPEQTAKAFIQPPEWTTNPTFPESLFSTKERMYRTGDLVRLTSNGSVVYVSRKDTQIKLNGRRIELGEIEYHCRTGLPENAQASVEVVTVGRNATKTLALFFSLPPFSASGFSLLPMEDKFRKLANQLETHLAGHLPTYMVPQLIIPVSAMPWTTAGKLDRRKLKQSIEDANSDVAARYRLTALKTKKRAPTSETEKKLQALWETVLNLPSGSVNAGDNFFGAGGDSLAAMRLVGVARAHKIVLKVLDIFENPVLADMAKAVDQRSRTTTDEDMPTTLKPFELLSGSESEVSALVDVVSSRCLLSRDQIQDMYPCSPLQEGLVTLALTNAGAYVFVDTIQLPEHIDLNPFKAAWQQVVDETDTLRTRIVHAAGTGFLQVVATPQPIEWHTEESVEDAVATGKTVGSQDGAQMTRYAIVEGQHGDGHQFVFAIHHALYDGWSLPLIVKRVREVYENGAGSATVSRAPYARFIQYLAQREIPASEKFWKDTLGDVSTIAHFPTLQQLPDKTARKFSTKTGKAAVSRANLRGVQTEISIPTLIRAAWAMVLSAHTATDDVVFGETLGGRNIDVYGVEEMTGPTFTTVPTRIRLDRGASLIGFLKDIQTNANKVASHQHLGLQRIMHLNEDCAQACGFQNLLVIQASSPGQGEADNSNEWTFSGSASTDAFFTHPLVLECTATDAAIEMIFHHDETALPDWHAQRLVHQLEAVLKRLADQVVNKKGAMVADVHAVSPEDEAIIAKWNRTSRPRFDKEGTVDSTIQTVFSERAFAQPHKVAVCGWDAEITYAELYRHTTSLASRLHVMGVGPGVFVPVCLVRSAWTVVTLMGIAMAGGAFVPLDPAHPMARHKEIIEEISPRIIVCSPDYASRYIGVVSTIVTVDESMIRSLPPTPGATTATSQAKPDNPAYVLFTSGSTGKPKGVLVAQREYLSSSLAYAKITNLNSNSRVFNFGSLTFDVTLMEIFTPLLTGGVVCVPTEEERLQDLGNAIVRLNATWAFLTPSVANLLDPALVTKTLKTLVCGGEALNIETIARWADKLELINGYGPTEACVLSIVNPRVSVERDPSIIGRATAAGRAWIIDPRPEYGDRLAPLGAVGELALSGPFLARGYLNDEEKTRRAFLEQPKWNQAFNGGPARIYRTGDLVRYRPDGALEFFGRRDGQIKVNGQRIELGEIESKLSADSRVSLSLVVQPKSGPCKKQLVGVLTLASIASSAGQGHECSLLSGPPELLSKAGKDLEHVKSRLAEMVPPYMVPSVWLVLEAMPLVVSGKLDRRKIAAFVEGLDNATLERVSSDLGQSESSADESAAELSGPAKTLREIWAKELNVSIERIKPNSAFMSVGGDSIRAMGVVSRARNAKIVVSVHDVLRSKSVVHLAQSAKLMAAALPKATSTGELEETEQVFELSPIQNMYMSGAEKHNGEARFNQSFALGVDKKRVDGDMIKRAIDLVVKRHGMLRARFVMKDGKWMQKIAKVSAVVLVGLFTLPLLPPFPSLMVRALTSHFLDGLDKLSCS